MGLTGGEDLADYLLLHQTFYGCIVAVEDGSLNHAPVPVQSMLKVRLGEGKDVGKGPHTLVVWVPGLELTHTEQAKILYGGIRWAYSAQDAIRNLTRIRFQVGIRGICGRS